LRHGHIAVGKDTTILLVRIRITKRKQVILHQSSNTRGTNLVLGLEDLRGINMSEGSCSERVRVGTSRVCWEHHVAIARIWELLAQGTVNAMRACSKGLLALVADIH